MANVRITDQTTDSSLSAGDYVIVDSSSEGTRKFDLGSELSDIKEDLANIEGGGGGVTDAVKAALLQLASKVAYIDDDGQDYYDDLYNALYAITAVRLNTSSISFSSINATQQLTATTTPEGGTVTWSSSDTSIATVSNGLVTSKGYGNATITASAGSVSATCSVLVAQATLSSISAVYTQSGTVYTTDSLDSLKTDLVVTAHWSNNTTSTVASTDYTLTGTLTSGTSTITVSYGGKTTTFTVTVTAPLYVTDGLIMWLDGEKNSANGAHNSSISTWVDQSGNEWDWTAGSGVVVGTNYMDFDMDASSQFTRDKSAGLPQNVAFVEIVIAADKTSITNYEALLTGFGNSYQGNVTRHYNDLIFHMHSGSGGSTTYPMTVDTNIHYYNSLGYIDGVLSQNVSTGGDDWQYTYPRVAGYGGSAGNQRQYPFDGKIYAIRLYSRVLTASEIAANYATDVTRFGIGA